jgi:hypothetical protein
MDPYLGAITIGVEIIRLGANIDGAEISRRTLIWRLRGREVGAAIIGADP